jgi:hypothetical protein
MVFAHRAPSLLVHPEVEANTPDVEPQRITAESGNPCAECLTTAEIEKGQLRVSLGQPCPADCLFQEGKRQIQIRHSAFPCAKNSGGETGVTHLVDGRTVFLENHPSPLHNLGSDGAAVDAFADSDFDQRKGGVGGDHRRVALRCLL